LLKEISSWTGLEPGIYIYLKVSRIYLENNRNRPCPRQQFQVDISCSFKVMDPVLILVNAKAMCKRGTTYRNIFDRVMGLVNNDVDTDGEHIFQVLE
jgi:hypothetical protein